MIFSVLSLSLVKMATFSAPSDLIIDYLDLDRYLGQDPN